MRATRTTPSANVERLADALQACFNDAARQCHREIEDKWGPRFDRMDQRLEQQNETLRMIWRQNGGDPDEHLPIDGD